MSRTDFLPVRRGCGAGMGVAFTANLRTDVERNFTRLSARSSGVSHVPAPLCQKIRIGMVFVSWRTKGCLVVRVWSPEMRADWTNKGLGPLPRPCPYDLRPVGIRGDRNPRGLTMALWWYEPESAWAITCAKGVVLGDICSARRAPGARRHRHYVSSSSTSSFILHILKKTVIKFLNFS